MTGLAVRPGAAHGGEVRRWIAQAPWWFHASLSGGLFWALMALYLRIGRDRDWAEAVVTSSPGGIFFGVVMGTVAVRQQRELRRAAGDAEYEQLAGLPLFGRRSALAARPDLREATARAQLHMKDRVIRQRRWAVPFFVVMAAVGVWLALTRSPWHWLSVVVLSGFLLGHLLLPAWIDRKGARLRDVPRPGAR